MVSTLDLMQEHQVETGLQGDFLDEEIKFLYTGMRLKPIYSKLKMNKKEFNSLCNVIMEAHTDCDYSLDCMINAVYNYVNKNGSYPPFGCFNDDIEMFLENYCVSIEDFVKGK